MMRKWTSFNTFLNRYKRVKKEGFWLSTIFMHSLTQAFHILRYKVLIRRLGNKLRLSTKCEEWQKFQIHAFC